MADDVTLSPLMRDILQHQNNPAGIQRAVFAELERASNGEIQVVDPTTPFVFTLESASVGVAAFMMQNEANTRKLYPFSAQTEEELYPHMSDKDFVNRFATAAAATFGLMFPVAELVQRMVEDPDTGYKKLVIPRNTYFTVADVQFSLQYPVEIRQLAHGGLTVVYNVEQTSPLQELSTNLIDAEIRRGQGQDWLYFQLETKQFSVISQKSTLNSAQDFRHTIQLTDLYYYTRVFVQNASNAWEEIRTTHTDQIYDIAVPTAVLKVVDNAVTVTIPQIYTSTKLLNKGIRIDAYQTKGPLNMLLYEYPGSAFQVNFEAFDKSEIDGFVAPLKTIPTIIPFSTSVVTGGATALTFSELRDRVIKNATGEQQYPITNVQIEKALDRRGYEVVKNIDLITNRVFLATRPMPVPQDVSLLTAAAASIETLSFKTQDAVLLNSVLDNDTQITVTPETVYKNVNGVTSFVPSNEVTALLALPAEERAAVISDNAYLFTPFHYVLDMAEDRFEARPYYLDNPKVETKLFVAENDTTLLQVGTGVYLIERTAEGYVLRVTTKSGDAFKELDDENIHVQLAYVPYGEKQRAYINGTLVSTNTSGERTYRFDLNTTFKIDKKHNVNFTTFSMYSEELISTFAPLLTEFDILYATSAVLGTQWRSNGVDEVLGKFNLPSRIAGINHEKLRIRFGYALDTLWARARSVISTAKYQKWESDVPRTYQQKVYEKDSNGSAVFIIADGEVSFNLLHDIGDPVLDSNNQPTYEHRKGDVKLNAITGLPIVLNPRGMMRQVDMMLIDGAYRFATDATTTSYRASLTATLVDWLVKELGSMTSRLLEQTWLYFYPKTTSGTVQVMVNNGQTKYISAGQSFRAELYVSGSVFANNELRARLTKTTIAGINEALRNSTVSIDVMTDLLRPLYGNDVISVKITGLGGAEEFQAVTILNDEDRLSIRKRLTAQADGSLIVEEDVTVDFVRHQLDT